MAATKKNGQNQDQEIDGLDFTNEEQISFAPYWKPIVGATFIARPLSRDERDPEFIRYVLQAYQDMECFSGPTDDAVPTLVRKGQQFSISQYKALPLDFYMGLPDPIKLTVKATRPSSDPKKNDMFVWGITTTDRCKKILDQRRDDPTVALPPGMTRSAPFNALQQKSE
jgi:hypothetical protein